jgi:Xaa-Pro aminopeptidase
MRTMHSVVKRGALYWDRDLIPESTYPRRIAAIQSRIHAAGDAAWLLVGDVIRHGPVVYATNFMPRVRSALVYIPAQGAPTLFANISLRDVPAARTITNIEDIRPFSRLPKDLATFLTEKLPHGSTIGLCGVDDCLPASDWFAIEEALPLIRWVARDVVIAAMRTRKDAFEIEAIRRSTALADLALDAAREVLKPGQSMRVVMAELDRRVRSRGAEDVRFLVAGGPQVRVALRPVDDRILQDGDTVMIYCAAQNQRYWGEAAQTYCLGTPSARQKALHARALSALDRMAAAIKPGIDAASIDAMASRELQADDASAARYGLGNAIGLDAQEGIVIASGVSTAVEPDTVIALRVILHVPEGGVAVSRSLHVGAEGCAPIAGRASLMTVC